MTTNAEIGTFNQVQMDIAGQAMKDPAFRRELLSDPRAVLEREMRKVDPGLTLPHTLQVHVHEQGPDTVHLTIPAEAGAASTPEIGTNSLTSSETWRKTLGTWDCGCL